jgi:hypothetical protein
MDFPKKVFDGVFELPLLREKKHKNQTKKATYSPHLLAKNTAQKTKKKKAPIHPIHWLSARYTSLLISTWRQHPSRQCQRLAGFWFVVCALLLGSALCCCCCSITCFYPHPCRDLGHTLPHLHPRPGVPDHGCMHLDVRSTDGVPR